MTQTQKKRGRPRLAEETSRLHLRLPKALAELTEEAAKREGVTASEWWRRAALLKLAGLIIRPPPLPARPDSRP